MQVHKSLYNHFKVEVNLVIAEQPSFVNCVYRRTFEAVNGIEGDGLMTTGKGA